MTRSEQVRFTAEAARLRLKELGVELKPPTIPQPEPQSQPQTIEAMTEALLALRVRTFKDFLKAAAKIFDVPVTEILGPGRTAEIVRARHAAAYVARTVIKKSFPSIGRALGGRDHTTILHAFKSVQKKIDEQTDPQFLAHLAQLNLIARKMFSEKNHFAV